MIDQEKLDRLDAEYAVVLIDKVDDKPWMAYCYASRQDHHPSAKINIEAVSISSEQTQQVIF